METSEINKEYNNTQTSQKQEKTLKNNENYDNTNNNQDNNHWFVFAGIIIIIGFIIGVILFKNDSFKKFISSFFKSIKNIFFFSSNSKNKKTFEQKEVIKKELQLKEEDKDYLDTYFEKYRQKAYHIISDTLAYELFLPKEIRDELEKKYPDPELNMFELNEKINLDNPVIKEYVLEYANKHFGIKSKDELLRYGDYMIGAVQNLIKKDVYYKLLDEIEPYVPEEERELFEKRKKEMRVFNF